jgi:hypothetical protein
MPPKKKPPAKRHRSAETGQYVSPEFAKRNKRTTVSETDKPKKRKKG